MKKTFLTLASLALTLALTGCSSATDTSSDSDVTTVKVGVVGEYNDQWDVINELLADDNIKVELVKFTDYATPNRALNDAEIDLNAFQHKAFLANDIKQNGYEITDIGDTVIAPLSIYTDEENIQSVSDLKDGDKVAIPSDLTNGGRALKLLESAGLIECDPSKGFVPTKADITKYNVKIDIIEAESGTLANLLPDCAAALINGGNAFTAGLDPAEDAIYTEDTDPAHNEAAATLVNVICCRTEEKDNEAYKKVVEAYQSDEVKQSVEESYHGGFHCAW